MVRFIGCWVEETDLASDAVVKQMMAIVGHVGSVQIVVRSEVHGVRGAN